MEKVLHGVPMTAARIARALMPSMMRRRFAGIHTLDYWVDHVFLGGLFGSVAGL